MKRTICFDFDGVIHSYTSGWCGPDIIPDPPVEGVWEAFDKIRQDWKIVVHSSRCGQPGGKEAIIKFLDYYGIIVDEVCDHKPPAVIYVDDRAVQFHGDWPVAMEAIKSFKHWQKGAI